LAAIVASVAPVTASDELVYQCPGPSGIALYTNQKRSGCEEMRLPELTIAPTQRADIRSNRAMPYGLRPFPSDWFDYAGPVGSLRNRLTQSGLYGMQDWLDYGAPVGSIRNSPAYWPSSYLTY
jgi:hypothetical protein